MAGEVIVKEAERDGGTLIAMATHGRSGIDRWLLGSVTEKVMRGTTNPLLLVRAVDDGQREGEALIKTVIVPLDGSPVAEKALPHALALATTMDLSLLLFGVYQLTQIISPSNRLLAAIKGEAASYLEEKVRELKRASVRVSELLVEGDAGDQIVDLACSAANSLVVICSHGRSGVRRWALGSVAERVLRHCSAPVLLVRSV
jgi:nucleotide-binding universal stress UspA family protein